METAGSKVSKNEPDKFTIETCLAIPESSKKYQHEPLDTTFQPNQSYTQAEIEEKFSSLITECNEKLEEIKPNEEFKIAIEWILLSNLLSLDVDCWRYSKNKTIGCGSFRSVHIRSSQRLSTTYKHHRQDWKKKWDLLHNSQSLDLNSYLLACQCDSKSENQLKMRNNDYNIEKIVGINLPADLQELENISYEFIIETGIPLALWSRCKHHKESNTNYITDLDNLITQQENTFNLQTLYQSIENQRLDATPEQPNHLGHHLCFLCENPYNYPNKAKLRL